MDINAQQLADLGIGGVIVYLFSRDMFRFLRHRKSAAESAVTSFEIKAALKELASNATRQTEILSQLASNQQTCRDRVVRIEAKVDRIG